MSRQLHFAEGALTQCFLEDVRPQAFFLFRLFLYCYILFAHIIMKYSCLEDSHSRKQSTLANSHVIYEEQLLDLEDREKDIWQNINNLR